jgi:HSP20 family protein
MTDVNNKTLTVLTILIAVLLVAVVAQSVAIFGFHKKLNTTIGDRGPDRASIVRDDEKGGSNSVAVLPPTAFDDDVFDWGLDGWDPFKEMHAMHDRINQMFGNAFNRFQGSEDFGNLFGDYSFSPDIDIQDKGDHYLVTVDLPGVEDSRVDVKIEEQTLTISGSMQSESKEEDGGHMLRQERRSGTFRRVVTLPGPVKADAMTTQNKRGVLRIEIPKADE